MVSTTWELSLPERPIVLIPSFSFRPSGRWRQENTAKSYVFRDESFGVIGAGCDVEADGSGITTTLRDGLKKRLRFVDSRVDVEAEKGEILRATIDTSGRSLALEMADSTSLANTARILVTGLAPGRYSVSIGTSTETRTVGDTLVLEWPLRDAKGFRIERMGDWSRQVVPRKANLIQ